MSRRYKSSTFKFNQPLSTPESKVVYRCNGTHGKAYAKDPPQDSRIRLLCISETRKVKWVDGLYTWQGYQCDEMRSAQGWSLLGWKMADGSLPLGELYVVDPELTQLGYLRVIDTRDVRMRTW